MHIMNVICYQMSFGLETAHAEFCIPAEVGIIVLLTVTSTMKAEISKYFPIQIILEQWVATAQHQGTNSNSQASFLAGVFPTHVFWGRRMLFEWSTQTHDLLAVRRQWAPTPPEPCLFIYTLSQRVWLHVEWRCRDVWEREGCFGQEPQTETEERRWRERVGNFKVIT